jgi:hypothetical protein
VKINNYNDFLLENFNSKFFDENFQKIISQKLDFNSNPSDFMIRMRKDFARKVKGLSEYFYSWFSGLASSDGDPIEDFNEMQKMLDKSGFNMDIIKKLFDKKVNQLLSQEYHDFIKKNGLDAINGYIDTYLYLLDEKLSLSPSNFLVDLGGGTGDTLNSELQILDSVIQNYKHEQVNEWLIKYAYGYHKTKYGKILLDSIDITPNEFERIAKEKLFNNLLILSIIDSSLPHDIIEIVLSELERKDFCRKEENKWVIQLERFWSISSSKGKRYEDFKDEFINWLKTKGIEENQIIDDDNLIEVLD